MTTPALTIRPAVPGDAQAMLDIHAPVVAQTAISFELAAPTLAELVERVRKISAGWVWLVAERDGQVIGYACGSPHRERTAYRWSTEVSAYVAPAAQRLGVGRLLARRGVVPPRIARRAGHRHERLVVSAARSRAAARSLHDA
jgi:L-amino acid N-acyltransferase YncA